MPTPDSNRPAILVAGGGALPRLLVARCEAQSRRLTILTVPGQEGSLADHECQPVVSLDEFQRQLLELRRQGFLDIIFAGNVQRPIQSRDPILEGGDDAVLRRILALSEQAGLSVIAVQALLPELVAQRGLMTEFAPDDADHLDIVRGREVVLTLGEMDIGQAAVVAHRQCLAVETIAGTDHAIEQAGAVMRAHRCPGHRGVLYKAPKTHQDLRIDMPTIGPRTIDAAIRAGLAGIAVQAGGVLIIDKPDVIARANQGKLFLIGD